MSKQECYQSQILFANIVSAKTWKLINTLFPGRTNVTFASSNLTLSITGESMQNPTDMANILNDRCWKNATSKMTHPAKLNCLSSVFTWNISWRNNAHHRHHFREKDYSSEWHPCENPKIMLWKTIFILGKTIQ